MDQDKVTGFYTEIAEVCSKYGMEGFVAMWFHATSDDYGFMHSEYNGQQTKVSRVTTAIKDKLVEFIEGIQPGVNKGFTEVIAIKKR